MIFYAVLAGAALALYLLTYVANEFNRYRHSKKLGCQSPPVDGNRLPLGIDHLLRTYRAGKEDAIPNMLIDISREHQRDTWAQDVLGGRSVVTTNPKNIQAILATQFRDFELGNRRRRVFVPCLGEGIFTKDGKPWEHSRAMLRPQFTRSQVSDLDLEERHVQTMFRHLQSDEQGWTSTVDMEPLFFGLTIDSATEFLFGHSVGSMLHSLPGGDNDFEWKHVAQDFDNGVMGIAYRGRLFSLYWLYNPKWWRDACHEVHRFADHYVKIALEKEKSGDVDKEKNGYVFLDEMVKVTKDPVVLRSELMNILLAGRDTTAGLLGWAIWSLARHPDVFQKLRGTILDTFGTYEHPREVTFERLKGCTYLQYVMNETLRLFPSVPLNARQAARDTSIPCGGGPDGQSPVFVKKGQAVRYWVGAMHRRKDLWGPDADKFDPDRWYGRKAGWEFLPFNGGPRICLGQQFALTEAGYVLTRLIQRFDKIENCDPNPVPLHQFSVTTAPRRVLVRLHEAAKS